MEEIRNGNGLNRNLRGYSINLFEEYSNWDIESFVKNEKLWFFNFAKKRVPEYVIVEENKRTMHNLLLYFLGIEGKLDLSKSICLYGNFGAGKSLFFSIIKDYFVRYSHKSIKYTHCPNNFITTSAEEIMVKGDLDKLLSSNIGYNDIENDYGVVVRNPKHILINELGKEY